jgi:cyclic pyranopterin phosphate synthase
MSELTHLDEEGAARMVDVGAKADTERIAVARGRVLMRRETLALIAEGQVPKGDTLAVARVAGIMAAKGTPSLIPLCHTLLLTHVRVVFELEPDSDPAAIKIEAEVHTTGKTGAEMEALAAVSVAALTIYDMCKAVDRGMRIADVRLVQKCGGKSGEWRAAEAGEEAAGAP